MAGTTRSVTVSCVPGNHELVPEEWESAARPAFLGGRPDFARFVTLTPAIYVSYVPLTTVTHRLVESNRTVAQRPLKTDLFWPDQL